MKEYYLYILRSEKTNKIYIGHSQNVGKRLRQHNAGESDSTRFACDWAVVHTEAYSSRSLAMKREKFLKSGRGRKILKTLAIIIGA